MRAHPFSTRTLLVAAALLAACADAPTVTGPDVVAPPTGTADEAVALSLDELAASASLAGDSRAASDYADGALAIRLGARPTEIAISVGGQDYRYHAVGLGIVERGPDGAELLKRTVIAWHGLDRPDAVLRVMSRSDAAIFGREDNPGDLGRATGTWADLARGARFVAIDGALATTLNSVAEPCPNAAADRRFACNLARFDIRMDGTFELVGDATARVPIASEAQGFAGVVVRRLDGGSGGRPTANPSRPQPTRG
ncbi:MAG: hypothetical protein KC544_01625 [Gemmatimonadetes bacterium]|nr:hypothetical protein [Gemmatimonadota bacterium]MCB9505590.1 hypothetical protein [Gemmatimonadales bacterium]MCA9768526.1 hypothetical protein [Gemmatimonadota bacterium]MCB9518588.1 hypothetical protein [Gemmatimonadales bacterium]HPF62214.1 hypothetical protein [Gemmatimonadales bacterium]